MPRPKHHYVPRFYLERFSNPKGQLCAFDRSIGKSITTSVKNVASETEYYTVLAPGGEKSEAVEHYLSEIEGKSAAILASFDLHDGRLSVDDRMMMAILIALQLVRTPKTRAMLMDIPDTSFRMMLEINTVGRTRQQVKTYLSELWKREPTERDIEMAIELGMRIDSFKIKPSQNELVRSMLQMAKEIAVRLFQKPWIVYTSTDRQFFTSDQPVSLWQEVLPEYGVGVATADQIYFPVDPYTVLSMEALDRGIPESLTIESCDRATSRRIQTLTAHGSLRWVYSHPKHHDPLNGISLPTRSPIGYINGRPVYEGEGSWDVLRQDWMPHVARVNKERASASS